MKHFALASLLGYFASAETCAVDDDTMSSCYSDLLAHELEMFIKLEEQDEEMGAGLAMSRPTKLNQIQIGHSQIAPHHSIRPLTFS